MLLRYCFIFFLFLVSLAEIQQPIGVQGEKGQLMGPFNYVVEDDMLHLDKAIGTTREKRNDSDENGQQDMDEEL